MLDDKKYEKFLANLGKLRDGDIMFTSGKSFLAETIQAVDHCHFNHCGVVKIVDGMPAFTIESLHEGVTPFFLSKRIKGNADYVFYRPKNYTAEQCTQAIDELIQDAADSKIGVKYDKPLLLKIGLARLIPIRGLSKQDNKAKNDICSEFVRRFTDKLGIKTFTRESMLKKTGSEWITPSQFLDLNSGDLEQIIFE